MARRCKAGFKINVITAGYITTTHYNSHPEFAGVDMTLPAQSEDPGGGGGCCARNLIFVHESELAPLTGGGSKEVDRRISNSCKENNVVYVHACGKRGETRPPENGSEPICGL